MPDTVKQLESRLRSKAKRLGLVLVKYRSRNPNAMDFGWFMIVDAHTNYFVAGDTRMRIIEARVRALLESQAGRTVHSVR